MIQIPAVIEWCAGIDIGKREVAVAIITGPADEDGVVQTRTFGTTVPALEQLRKWLIQEGCSSVAMESTGSYWIPVKNILEGALRIVLVCPRKHKPEPGDKTDFRDAENLGHLHRHGLLQGSFLPRREVVEIRDLTRRRKNLLSALAAEKNRIQKVLETANVKIGSVASDVFGVSGQAMIGVLLSAKAVTAEQIAELSGELGRYLSRQQPLGRQKQAEPDQKSQQVSAGRAGASRVGGRTQKGLVIPAPFSPLDVPARRAQGEANSATTGRDPPRCWRTHSSR